MAVTEVLQELLASDRPLRASRLAYLSDLHRDEKNELAEVWPRISTDRRQQLIESLIDLAEDNPELIFDDVFLIALSDTDASVRVLALRGLWEYESTSVLPTLIRLAEQDSDIAVRAEAALLLGRFAVLAEIGRLSSADASRLNESLRSIITNRDESVEVRARAVEAAGVISEPWVEQMIRWAYNCGNHRLRVSAVHAMGRNADPEWLPSLLKELESDDPELRYESAIACGSLGLQEAVPQLASHLDDDDVDVRTAVISSLGQIGGREAKTHLTMLLKSPDSWVRDAATQALAEADFNDDPLAFHIRG